MSRISFALGGAPASCSALFCKKAQVTKYQKVVSFFRWSDLTVQKVMFAAILSGMIGVYALHDLGLVNLHIKPAPRGRFDNAPFRLVFVFLIGSISEIPLWQ